MEHTIRHRVGINAPIDEVYKTFATREGGSRWWTRTVEGDDSVGGKLVFMFGSAERAATVEIVELTAPSRVVWRFTDVSPEEWLGTTATFELKENGDETVVLFAQAGWREPVEFMHHCTTAWGYFLLSAKHLLEGRKATPWPDNELISTWG